MRTFQVGVYTAAGRGLRKRLEAHDFLDAIQRVMASLPPTIADKIQSVCAEQI